MDKYKYKVELAAPAVRMYDTIRNLAAGEKRGPKFELFQLLDCIIDEALSQNPFELGTELCGSLRGVYWISKNTLHIFYELSAKPSTIVILSIWDGPHSEAHMRQADILCTQILLKRNQQSNPGTRMRIAAAN
jgi:hypothetical protein